ncbi:MAG: cytochrome c oxidase accessory protein CcoG [Pseudomonadales bacterium]|nr:cytochrome c oxidase accessory protein CcoG [Pseudomonadales bacterium]MDP4640117.1 cytochrome c oxidase accessory protein CcoG [Pseudomonadales bacterium]MDP4766558.1 cytochrome c oxidase accessory protein CcoG [Pseudomonadales bacterium]MDP4876048.1 cytochrome c oxidase accessory protein CcoG [Pseudomonadales bacterium]MDP4912216.1 cytochrome c oxidase accessory protein CcoG [Pseudomonadales bacterium]
MSDDKLVQIATAAPGEGADVDSKVYNLYEKREKIFTRKIEGYFQHVRLFTGWPLLLGYFLIPWLLLDGRQAILFDLPARKFHIFWLTFWPQDFGFLAWALMIAAFGLFFVTTLLGRVWCGYTCPQTVWTAIFMWAEQVAEGERHQRINLQQAPWSMTKFFKRFLKHGMWVGFAALTGFTFVAYFYGARELLADIWQLQLTGSGLFWSLFFTTATYVNAGWMREQVCLHMCPYARFQSAMFDKDTLIVSYDPQRGEPRGARKRSAEPAKLGLGACIDCSLCVQVCPTGIDIRDGLQYECINCAYCIDACDSIMDKMGYAPGLIKYTTENALAGKGWTWKRPKLVGYGLAMLVMVSVFAYSLFTRVPLGLDVLRNRGQLYQEVPGGLIRNTYLVKILNMDRQDFIYRLQVTGLPNARLVPDVPIEVKAGQIGELSVDVLVNPDLLQGVNTEIDFTVETTDGRWRHTSESRYLGPMPVGGTRGE